MEDILCYSATYIILRTLHNVFEKFGQMVVGQASCYTLLFGIENKTYKTYLSLNLFYFRDFSVDTLEYKIDGKEWYHYFLCGYKVCYAYHIVFLALFVAF